MLNLGPLVIFYPFLNLEKNVVQTILILFSFLSLLFDSEL